MTIQGFEHSRYYLFNPIKVELFDTPNRIDLEIELSGTTYNFEFYAYNGYITFDLAPIILGLIPMTTNKTDLLGVMDGVYIAKVTIRTGQPFSTIFGKYTKYFFLGGKMSLDTNILANTNLNLNFVKWQGYPYWISAFQYNQVVNLEDDSNMKTLMPRVECDNIFIAYRNNRSGFSYYLFEDFNVINDSKSQGYYLTNNLPKVMGTETKLSINVRSKVLRDFYSSIKDLANSFEIYIYNLPKIIDSQKDWVRVEGSNAVDFNNKKRSTDIEMKFNVITNFNKVW